MAREAFSFKTKAELERMPLLELNVHITELKRRAAWVTGFALQSIQRHLEVALSVRDNKRKQGQTTV